MVEWNQTKFLNHLSFLLQKLVNTQYIKLFSWRRPVLSYGPRRRTLCKSFCFSSNLLSDFLRTLSTLVIHLTTQHVHVLRIPKANHQVYMILKTEETVNRLFNFRNVFQSMCFLVFFVVVYSICIIPIQGNGIFEIMKFFRANKE